LQIGSKGYFGVRSSELPNTCSTANRNHQQGLESSNYTLSNQGGKKTIQKI